MQRCSGRLSGNKEKGESYGGPQAAGYIFQLERALYHLSRSGAEVSVAVEFVDDVVQLKDGLPVLQEQDKNTVRSGVDLLGDRSEAL